MKHKKSLATRFICFVLTASMLLSSTGCNNGAADNWNITQQDISDFIELTATVEGPDSQDKVLTVTCEDDLFKSEISQKDVYVVPLIDEISDDAEQQQAETEASAQTEASASEESEEPDDKEIINYNTLEQRSIKNVTVTFISAGELELSFSHSAENLYGYYVYVNKNAVQSGKYAVASVFVPYTQELESETAYIAEIAGTYTNKDENPTIELTLGNTTVVSSLSNDMFKLDGAFAELTVKSVSGKGSAIHIATEGKLTDTSSLSGTVIVGAEATEAQTELCATVPVEYADSFVDEASYAYSDGELTFSVVLANDTFVLSAEQLAQNMTTQIEGLTVKSISDEKTTAVLALKADNADNAVLAVRDREISFDGAAVASGSAFAVTACAASAAFGVSVDYAEKSEADGAYTADAYIYISHGSAEDLAPEDFTFDGDFATAEITSLEKQSDGSYLAKLSFTVDAESDESLELNGDVYLAPGKLINLWGSESDNLTADIIYFTATDRGETWDLVKAFVSEHKSSFKTISTVGSAIGGIASAASGIYTILGMVGVVETTDDKLDKIYESMQQLSQSVSRLNAKVESMEASLRTQLVDVEGQNYLLLYRAARSDWNAFLTGPVQEMNNQINAFTRAYNSYLLDYIKNEYSGKNEVSIDAWVDSDGNIAVPSAYDESLSVDGRFVRKETLTLTFTEAPTAVHQKIAANGGKIYSGVFDDIKEELSNCVDGDKQKVNRFVEALQLDCVYGALSKIDAGKLIDAYVDLCSRITGSVAGGPVSGASGSPLSDYYDMLSYYYNFESEAKDDMEDVLAWLSGIITKGAGIAVIANDLDKGSIISGDELSKAYNSAVTYIRGFKYLHELKENQQYCFISDSVLSVSYVYANFSDKETYLTTVNYGRDDGFKFPSSCLNLPKLELMKKRWSYLYKAGETKASSFNGYLESLGLVTSEAKDGYVLTESPIKQSLPTDNSVTLKCYNVITGSWFKVGSDYSIGSSGKRSAKYFRGTQLMGQAYSLSDGSVINRLIAVAGYSERHWYWFHDEIASFFYRASPSKPFMIFATS